MSLAASPDSTEPYRDHKRYAWICALLVPIAMCGGPLLTMLTGRGGFVWLPVVIVILVVPFLDWVLGEDTSNPPESAVAALEADPYYRYVTWAAVPVLWICHFFSVWFVMTQHPSAGGVFAVVFSTGILGGFSINIGHELGHRSDGFERWLAKFILAPSFYGHFYIEHNKGHHRDVATHEDPASARMGETVYAFVLREMPGALRRGWKLEADRLRKRGRPVWSLENEILQPALISVTYWTALVALFGPWVLPLLLVIAFWSNFQLTMANYVEHYGLLRRQRPDGRVERCEPHHSWNSNHVFSNWALFHLQRHSDHHAHPSRRYQALRHFDAIPQLPSGYFGMFIPVLNPPVWFWLMDRRLLETVGRDVSRINFDPKARDRLIAKYNLSPAPLST
jgi:alkane 1-monooxygenase